MLSPRQIFEDNIRPAELLLKVYRLLEHDEPNTEADVLKSLREIVKADHEEAMIVIYNEVFLGLIRERAQVPHSAIRRSALLNLLRQAVVCSCTALETYLPALLTRYLEEVVRYRGRNFIPSDQEVATVCRRRSPPCRRTYHRLYWPPQTRQALARFFQVKNYADEFEAALEGKAIVAPTVEEEDETISIVADDIEQQSRDFVLKQIHQKLKGHGLAEFVAHLLNLIGYKTKVSPPGPDRGIDLWSDSVWPTRLSHVSALSKTRRFFVNACAAIRSSWELTTSTHNSKSRTSERSTRQLEGRILAGEEEWIDKYRATLIRTNPPRRWLSSVGLGAVALGALFVGTIYVLHVCLLR